MKRTHSNVGIAAVLTVALLTAGHAAAQTPAAQEPYKPTVGQAGKDAVWVPTSTAMVEKMLDHAKVTPQDFVIDLGSGDGRTIIAAARRGARGLGVEYNPDLVEFSKRQAAAQGVSDKAAFVQGDMYAADISKATVLALFLLPSNLEKLQAKFLDLPPGTRIVANTFWIPGWTPDDTQTMTDNCDNWCTSMLFIVPAKVAGKWSVGQATLTLAQEYQMVTGTYVPAEGAPAAVKGRLNGNELTLLVNETEYKGRVVGDRIEGAAVNGPDRSQIVALRVR